MNDASVSARIGAATLMGVALISAALLMTELALTRIFSVTMYYHFAFLAISIGLFGLSTGAVWVFITRDRLNRVPVSDLLSGFALGFAVATIVSLAALVRIRVGLTYSPSNLSLMLVIYVLAATPFFVGGSLVAVAVSRLHHRVNLVYGADLLGAAAGCLLLIPAIDTLGAPGAIVSAAGVGLGAAVLLAAPGRRHRVASVGAAIAAFTTLGVLSGLVRLDIQDTKGHQGDRILFSKWNSFSRVAVYDRAHGDWALSDRYAGPLPESRFMDIDSAASTPILRFRNDIGGINYLRFDLTALAYALVSHRPVLDRRGASASSARPFTALVIGPGGGRDLLSALAFGAGRVDGVEVNPIIATDVMTGAFREFSGRLYEHPRVRITIDDGRSFVRRSSERYDIIQASLVDTWAATAAGAYTLTENALYTVEAFNDYLDHLTTNGILTITRWEFDGVRLISLAQDACATRGLDARRQLAIVQHKQFVNVFVKRTPFADEELAALRQAAEDLGFTVLYAPEPLSGRAAGPGPDDRSNQNDYRRLVLTDDREAFLRQYPRDVGPTSDDRPFFFHTTKLKDQPQVAFGRSMLFGNGLSALLTLMGLSTTLVCVCILAPLAVSHRRRPDLGAIVWLSYFGALGAGFMLIEVVLLQRFVLLLGHPVYSLTVTLTSLLVGTGLGSLLSRRIPNSALSTGAWMALASVIGIATAGAWLLPAFIHHAMGASREARIALTVALLIPAGAVMGIPLPTGIRLLAEKQPMVVPWAWGLNGACSVVGAALAVFVAMNWGFTATLWAAAATYAVAALVLIPSRVAGGTTRFAKG